VLATVNVKAYPPFERWLSRWEGIILRTSQLDPDVLVSPHPAPDVLGLRLCSCGDNRGSFREPLEVIYFPITMATIYMMQMYLFIA
jgi:hypothetical protein